MVGIPSLELLTWNVYVHRIHAICRTQLWLSVKPLRGAEIVKTSCYVTAGKLKFVISSCLSTGASANTITCQTAREIWLSAGVCQVFGSSETQYISQQMVVISKTQYRYIPDMLLGIPVFLCCSADYKLHLKSSDTKIVGYKGCSWTRDWNSFIPLAKNKISLFLVYQAISCT